MKKKPIKPDSGIKDVYEEYAVTTRQWNGDWSVQKRTIKRKKK